MTSDATGAGLLLVVFPMIVWSPEELQELEEWFKEQDQSGGLNGEPAVWGPSSKANDGMESGGSYLDTLN